MVCLGAAEPPVLRTSLLLLTKGGVRANSLRSNTRGPDPPFAAVLAGDSHRRPKANRPPTWTSQLIDR